MNARALPGLRPAQLRWRLLAFFAALAVPAALLFWFGNSRLNWEVFHQYRTLAETLTRDVDRDLGDGVAALEQLDFDDYAYLTSASDVSDAVVQRSPIADWPVEGGLPGLIGYFQVDAAGGFSSPILPPADASADKLGIDAAELAARRARAAVIIDILVDNRLVPKAEDSRLALERGRADGLASRANRGSEAPATIDADAPAVAVMEEIIAARGRADTAEARSVSAESAAPAGTPQAPGADGDAAGTRGDEGGPQGATAYDQGVFDALNTRRAASAPARQQAGATAGSSMDAEPVEKLSELQLDERLQRKSERAEYQQGPRDGLQRARETKARAEPSVRAVAFGDRESDDAAGNPVPIDAFRRDTGAYELGVLDSGHLVLFRDAYRDGERFIQGALLARGPFIGEAIGVPFERATVSGMASLIVALGDDVVANLAGAAAGHDGGDPASGTLLYRSRLAAPLDRLELVYTVDSLPAGAGARVLVWTGVAFALILAAGMLLLYRLGAGQIALARQQQDFVAAVSHELKTPLTSIRMYAEMLREGWVGDDKRAKYYRYIHDESERLARLIANVLQLARITRNESEPDLRTHNVGALLEETEGRIASQVAHAGFELRMRVDARAARSAVRADSDAVAQIMINLVDNAIKFAGEGAQRIIEVGARRGGGGMVVLFVRDFGPGVSPDQMKKIFQLFYRPESELTRETAGTGIGLAIVRELTVAMGGRVDCVNREPGAEFQVALPCVSDG